VPDGTGRYPFPYDAPIEGTYPGCNTPACNANDRHVIAVDNATCKLYEAWRCFTPQPGCERPARFRARAGECRLRAPAWRRPPRRA
jgi:hypothetical protein